MRSNIMFKIGMLNSIKLKTNVLIINAMAISLFFLLLLQTTIAQAEFVVMPDEAPDWAPAAAAAGSVIDTHSETSAEAVNQQAGKDAVDKQYTATKPIDDLRTDSMHRDSMQRHSMPMPSMHMPSMNMPSAQNNAMQRNAPYWRQRQEVHGQGAQRQAMQNAVPPPPPGPYKSTAMSEYSKQAHATGRVQHERNNSKQGQMETGQTEPDNIKKEQIKTGQAESEHTEPGQQFNPAQVPMDVYSPERPWPENIRPANPWAPDYSRPSAATQYRMPANPAAMYNYPADRYYGYRQGPGMRAPDTPPPYMQAPYMRSPQMQAPHMQTPAYWPNMNSQGSNWIPSMGAGSRRPGATYSPPETPYTERPYEY